MHVEVQNDKEVKIKEYLNKYLLELQRHFDLSDGRMREILYKVYKEHAPTSFFLKTIKKYMSMVKSTLKDYKEKF